MTAAALRASVVIATRNRKSALGLALDSLERQTLGAAAFEVVVVDDGSTDGTAAAAEERGRRGPLAIRVVRQAQAGPAAARNAGAAAARGAILAFHDDDVVADPEWLAAGLVAFSSERVGAVEGRVRVAPRERIGAFTRLVENEAGGRYLTANLFVRAEVFRSAGGFDVGFGPHDYFREDTDLAYTLLEAGHAIPFAPAALVFHPPAADGPLWPLRQARKYRHDRRLWRKHPALCREQLDAQRMGGLLVRRPRQRSYVLASAALAAGIALGLTGRPAVGLLVGFVGSAPAMLLHLAPLARARSLGAVLAAPVVAAVAVVSALLYVTVVTRATLVARVRAR